MMNKKVKVTMRGLAGKATVFTGKVVDTNSVGTIVYVERDTDGDWIGVNLANPYINTIEVIKEKTEIEIVEANIQKFLDDNCLSWDGFGGNDEVTYEISGHDRYSITLGIDFDDNGNIDGDFYLCTTHIQRYDREDNKSIIDDPYKDPISKSKGNECYRKTLKGVFSYITKFGIEK